MKYSSIAPIVAIASATVPGTSALCPRGFEIPPGAEGETHASWVRHSRRLEEVPSPPEPTPEYLEAMEELDIEAVKEDLKAVMTDSQDWWPADYGNYGPLFVRLAWHCSGTFRISDGRGGCAGGRQRFEPERSWADNINLDKARRLLEPIKEKYGLGLSYGDLYVMAGTTAIEAMGGPTLGVCLGRVDEDDGARSIGLDDCGDGEDGACGDPMGATTMELIYVNPEGPMAQPFPDESALQVRDTFSRMGMDDRETVALIGGGHAFGKAHGACNADNAAGLTPNETSVLGLDPNVDAWKGKCGETGSGADAWTSGIEGPWTTNPIQWDNDYFKLLLGHEWSNTTGPGGKHQWHSSDQLQGLGAFGGNEEIMMLTTDVALLHDPEEKYQGIVKEFAEDSAALDEAFAAAWHKLTTSAFGNIKYARCTGAAPYVAPDEDEETAVDASENEAAADEAETEEPLKSGAHSLLGAILPILAVQAMLLSFL